MFYLAKELHTPIGQVLAMPHSELTEWRAFYAVQKALGDLLRPR